MIVIVDYGMGNIGSILNMLKKIGHKAVISSDPGAILDAEKLILPGVGSFDTGMRHLHDSKLLDALNEKALNLKTPILGICLGMQLLTEGSEEGDLPGLGWIPGETIKFRFEGDNAKLKVPHMGWNGVTPASRETLFYNLEDPETRFYFVHSYRVVCRNPEDALATTRYGVEFHSSVQRGNIMGTQFHPEKSHKFGMQLLRNFAERC